MILEMILRWQLRILMAEINIGVGELSELAGVHRSTVSRLKNNDYPSHISMDALTGLCSGLTKAYRTKYADTGEERFNRIITPHDLFEVITD